MLKTLLKLGAALSAVTLAITMAHASATHADGPYGDLNGINQLGAAMEDLGKLAPAAEPPASSVEAPATTSTGTDSGTTPGSAPAGIPTGGTAPATLTLPNAGTGSASGSSAPMLALIVALAGAACVGVAFTVRRGDRRS